jgi:hypothetical protein
MLGTRSRLPPGPDFATVGQKALQHVDLFVVNVSDLLLTEEARFTSPAEPTASAPLRPLSS